MHIPSFYNLFPGDQSLILRTFNNPLVTVETPAAAMIALVRLSNGYKQQVSISRKNMHMFTT